MSNIKIPQSQDTTENNLDALCDMLDEDDPDEEAEESFSLDTGQKEKSSNIPSKNNPLLQSNPIHCSINDVKKNKIINAETYCIP